MLHSVQRCHMLLLTCRSHLWAIKIDGNINTITFNRKNTEIVDRFAMPGNALLQLSCKSFRSSSLDRKFTTSFKIICTASLLQVGVLVFGEETIFHTVICISGSVDLKEPMNENKLFACLFETTCALYQGEKWMKAQGR